VVSQQGCEPVLTRVMDFVHSTPVDAVTRSHSSSPLSLSLHALLDSLVYFFFFVLVEHEKDGRKKEKGFSVEKLKL
jgi:hypothetical protein